MKKAAIIGGNKLAEYLSIELRKKNFSVFFFSRAQIRNKSVNKIIKIKNYNFKNL